jgi:hypothetical protein
LVSSEDIEIRVDPGKSNIILYKTEFGGKFQIPENIDLIQKKVILGDTMLMKLCLDMGIRLKEKLYEIHYFKHETSICAVVINIS